MIFKLNVNEFLSVCAIYCDDEVWYSFSVIHYVHMGLQIFESAKPNDFNLETIMS